MNRLSEILLTALAPIVWGSTYLVTSEWLPDGYPITMAMLRALPAGLLMLLFVRCLPSNTQWGQAFILGGLNFTIFWICLFISAYRLPGGVAAMLGASQPLIVIGLGHMLLKDKATLPSILCALAGVLGVSLLVLKSNIELDLIGILAAFCGAASMAMGTVLTKKWRGDVPLLTFTSWQLTAGGLLLLPLSLFLEPNFPQLNFNSVLGLIWLGLVGALISYALWFRGIARLGSLKVSILAFLSPVTAILLGWAVLGQNLNTIQIIGTIIILTSIIFINTNGVNKHAHT